MNRTVVALGVVGLGLALVAAVHLALPGTSQARGQAAPAVTDIEFPTISPTVGVSITVRVSSTVPWTNVQLGIDAWQFAQDGNGDPWPFGSRPDPDDTGSSGMNWWEWYVILTQTGEYLFTFYPCHAARSMRPFTLRR